MLTAPIPLETIALASLVLSIGCLFMAAFHAIRFERHQHHCRREGGDQP